MILLPTSGRGIVILSNSNDLLVGNRLMKTIFASTMKILTGEPPADQDGADYLSQHLVFNAIYLAIFLGAALPAVGLKRWVKTVQQRKTWRVVFWDLLAHLAYPLGLAAIPYVLGYPYFLMRGYIPDLYLVWMTAIGIALITGVIKAGWWLRHRRHVRPSGPA
jgi:hypothetical protein